MAVYLATAEPPKRRRRRKKVDQRVAEAVSAAEQTIADQNRQLAEKDAEIHRLKAERDDALGIDRSIPASPDPQVQARNAEHVAGYLRELAQAGDLDGYRYMGELFVKHPNGITIDAYRESDPIVPGTVRAKARDRDIRNWAKVNYSNKHRMMSPGGAKEFPWWLQDDADPAEILKHEPDLLDGLKFSNSGDVEQPPEKDLTATLNEVHKQNVGEA